MRKIINIAAAIAAMALTTPAIAEYPERPISLVIPYAPGGTTDLSARILVPFLEKHLGTNVVVENRGGAGTIIGATTVANARPDGYTLGKLVFPTSYGHIVTGDANYKLDSFTPLANQWVGRSCICVAADSKFKTLADFVAQAKVGKMNVGVVSLSSAAYFASRLLEQAAGYQATHVPFDGGAAVTTALLGGHILAGAMPASEVLEQFRAGKIRPLAILSDTRWEEMPDAPTARELGYNAAFDSLGGYVAPAGVPDDVKAKLVKAFESALEDPEYLAVAKKNSLQILYMNGAEYSAYLSKAFQQLTDLIKQDLDKTKKP